MVSNSLTAVSYDMEKGKWLCHCKCGNITFMTSSDLVNHTYKSCRKCGIGHLSLKSGDEIGNLTIIRWDRDRKKWFCKCKCGNDTYASTSHLKSGTKKGCGCLIFAPKKRLPDNLALKNCVWQRYKRQAKKRELPFELSKKEFLEIISGKCYYCNSDPISSSKYFRYYDKDFNYNGIDRLDNDKGYSRDNCVTCCITCNHAKSAMSTKDFLGFIKKIYENHNL